jgi:polyisoprenoid-binding protein YceI
MATLNELLADPQTAGAWGLVPGRSTITVKAKSLWGLVPVKGRLSEVSGDGRVGSDGSVTGRIVIPVRTLKTGIGKRDEHLLSADFFDAQTYPDITVDITEVRPVDAARADVRLDLTVRGATRPVALTASVDVLPDGLVHIAGSTTLNRNDFGVSGNMIGMIGPAAEVSADLLVARSTGAG